MKIELDYDNICTNMWASTFNYGGDKPSVHLTGNYNLVDVYLQAINRGIDLDTNEAVMCRAIMEEIPSTEWQTKAILSMSDRSIISENQLKLVKDYGSYAFERMNNKLRKYPNSEALINNIIDKMPPIDKNIIVYRYVLSTNYLPVHKNEVFTSYGYLSTSMDAMLAVNVMCNNESEQNSAVMKIRIPKGTKAVYLPGRERELLFKHECKLKLIDIHEQKVVCSLQNNANSCHILDGITMYEFEYID